MKKLLVLVVAMLALASFVTMAHADTTIFTDSWVYPLAAWQGSNQLGYPDDPHAITDAAVPSPFAGESGFVGQIIYNKSQESWAGRLTVASPGANLSGVTRLTFKVRSADTMNQAVRLDKVTVNDANGNQLTLVAGLDAPVGSWYTFTSPSTVFTGRNMASCVNPFGFYLTSSGNSAITGNDCIFYFDDVKFIGGGSGTVLVTITSGVVGAQVENVVNFDLLAPLNRNTSYNSADISDQTQNRFIVTNMGSDPCYYVVSLVNPGGWTAVDNGTAANATTLSATDTYSLWAQFSPLGYSPMGDLASYSASDILTTADKHADGGVLDYTGTGDGINVPKLTDPSDPNDPAKRNLWIALHTPPLTTVSTTQQIIVSITAVMMPTAP